MAPPTADPTARRAAPLLVRRLAPRGVAAVGPRAAAWLPAFADAGVPHLAADADAPADLVVALDPPAGDLATYADALTRRGRAVLVGGGPWPAVWADAFARRGYAADDFLRPRLWDDPDADGRLVQGLVLFAPPPAGEPARFPRPAAYVHPQTYRDVTDPDRVPASRLLGLLAAKAGRAASRLARRALAAGPA